MNDQFAVTVRLFGAFEEIAGSSELSRRISPDTSVDELWAGLVREWPALTERDPVRLSSVNLDFADGDRRLVAGDEVAFFPPVSGG